MLILFHCVVILIKHFIKLKKSFVYQKPAAPEELIFDVNTPCFALLDAKNMVKFDPPVYKQRYGQVCTILSDEKWKSDIKKVVDFGCAEYGLFLFLKRLPVAEILFVDVDKALLDYNLFKILPLTYEYLERRDMPLTVHVLAGSISDPDHRLLNTDAVIAIEIIEHLYPDILEAFPYNIFSFIQPKLVIVTTPNADFNVIFKREGFRHYDHKFEWTRDQFEEWAQNIVVRFPQYTVHFAGIGCGPESTEHLGYCSQMALFVKSNPLTVKCKTHLNCDCDNCRPKTSYGICTYNTCSNTTITKDKTLKEAEYYELVESIEYPYNKDTRSEEEKLLDELRYRINMHCSINSRFFNEDDYRIEIPLTEIVYRQNSQLLTISEAETLLTKIGYKIEECRNGNTGETDLCVTYEMDNNTTTSDGYESETASGCDSDRDLRYSPVLSDWDDEPKIKEDLKKSKKPGHANAERKKKHQDFAVIDTKETAIQDSLIDSGYQKSLPDSPVTPVRNTVTKDTFHSATFIAGPSICILNPLTQTKELISPIKNDISLLDITALDTADKKMDYDRINELDSFSNQNQYYRFAFPRQLPNQCLKPDIPKGQFLKENAKLTAAGPSEQHPASKKKKRLSKSSSSDSNDSTIDDIKSITTCLLENTLNFIESNKQHVDVIEDIAEPAILLPIPLPFVAPEIEFPVIVENGDLANNNRDFEGNNYPQQDDIPVNIENADENNLNLNGNIVNHIVDEMRIVLPNVPVANEDDDDFEEPEEVAHASREALFDPNSQIDLLDDIVIPEPLLSINEDISLQQNNFVLIGLNINRNEDQLATEEDEGHDEPHFYCQGDGLGVHPSVIAVDIDDDDAVSSDTSSDSVDYAEAQEEPIEDGMSLTDQDQNNITEDASISQDHVDDIGTISSQPQFYDTFEE